MTVIAPGTPAPEFRLTREDGSAFTQEDLKGRFTIFVFYPFAFSPVCTDQLQMYEDALGGFAERGVQLYGVSCDAGPSQAAFKEKLSVSCEQLSDFEPKGAACAALGVLHPGGFAERALAIFDADGVVRWSFQAASPGELPALKLLRSGLEIALAAGAASPLSSSGSE
ncbi:MAG TPA: redoxin domain-containing protein [Solirubrobacteraceae bacterium]|jgi:peroxiredoxin (alkyl hydroperoxide reductase subunit C)|nr:redoxin domain-containing protein [Solirubrobacteraceae bacterium]